jgi:hypothetical protein
MRSAGASRAPPIPVLYPTAVLLGGLAPRDALSADGRPRASEFASEQAVWLIVGLASFVIASS